MPPRRKNLFGAPYRRPLTGFSRAPITSAPLRLSVFRKPTLFILWTIAPALKDPRIKVYGWVNPGISVSTSNKSNIPESYAIVPNH
jgi:hypothetical protein